MLELRPLFQADITLAAPQELGASPLGRRRIINITGGTFRGERLSGKVLPGGADWQVIRSDGVADLDARYTLETADGALIYVHNHGYRHGPADVLKKLAQISGGEYFLLRELPDVVPVCRQIASDIRNRYTLTYTPPQNNSRQPARSIRVTASTPSRTRLIVHTRTRYIMPERASATPPKGVEP